MGSVLNWNYVVNFGCRSNNALVFAVVAKRVLCPEAFAQQSPLVVVVFPVASVALSRPVTQRALMRRVYFVSVPAKPHNTSLAILLADGSGNVWFHVKLAKNDQRNCRTLDNFDIEINVVLLR